MRLNSSSAFVVGSGAMTLARMALPTRPSMPFKAPVGSAPFRGVNGAPLWKVTNPLNCQPPSRWPTKPRLLAEPGQLVNEVAGEAVRSVVRRARAVGLPSCAGPARQPPRRPTG